jgi:tetratricopeptide (TPR) repeat protein
MDALNTAAKWVLLLGLSCSMCACTSLRPSWLGGGGGLGLRPDAPPPPVDADLQQTLNRLYVRGATALAANDLDATITAWREYAAKAPLHQPQTRQVRGYLTLLDREAAKRFARLASARERSGQFLPTDRLHVALFPFAIEGPQAAQPGGAFNRAVMAMIAVDLARVPSVTVLEREKVEALVQERKLADSGLVNPASMAAQGRLLGAGTVIAGSVFNAPGNAGPGSGAYKISSAVSDVGQGRVVGVQEAEGAQAEFFVLQKRLVYGILEALQVTNVPDSVHRVHTRSWEAYAQFARGLGLLSQDRFDEARKAFSAALVADPGFALAQEAFLDTPERAATFDELRSELQARL